MSPSWRASITVAALSGLYRVYIALVSPLITPVLSDDALPSVARANTLMPSQPAVVAREHLPFAEWAADATFRLSRGRGYVYFNVRRRIEDEAQKRVRFQPFALVWFDPRRGDNHPYTVTCDSAVVEFKEKFQFARADTGNNRIVGGSFEGEVRITGPDGLQVRGDNFFFSEKDGFRSDSDRPVSFAYGPAAGQNEQVRGHAERFEVTLTDSEESLLGQDMPRIGGFQKVVLRRNVDLDIVLDDEGRPAPISIQSDDQFEYNVEELMATFNDNVRVSRPTHAPGQPEEFDQLKCDQLTLTFEPKRTPETDLAEANEAEDEGVRQAGHTARFDARGTTGFDLDLQVHSVSAIGGEVVLTSDANEILGRMGDLHYNVANRTLEMFHGVKFQNVELQFGSSMLACPQIRCTLDAQDDIRTVRCSGAGQAWRIRPETGEIELASSWSEQLAMFPDPESEWDRLELHGDARVLHRPQHMGIVGDVLRVWFERRQDQTSGDRQLNVSELTTRDLAIRKVTAEQTGNVPVAMHSPTLRLETGRLEADFIEQTMQPAQEGAPAQRDLGDPLGRSGTNRSPVTVSAGEVRAAVVFDAATEQTDVARLTASTDVRVTRTATDQPGAETETAVDGPFSVECEQLVLRNENGVQSLRLVGAPARLLMPEEAEIEGNDILLNRQANEAQVTGPGTILVFVDRDFDGNPLQGKARELTVRWRERMRFDGRTAKFLGEVQTVISSSDLDCPEMEVRLNRRIDFSDDHPRTDDLEVQSIHCQGGVVGKFLEWKGQSTLVGIRNMQVADLSFNRSTGKMRALGPGRIDDWQKGGGRVRFAPDPISRANQTAEADARKWNYTWLMFEGEMNGNQKRRSIELSDRVQVMHGPMKEALQVFKRDDFSENPELVKDAVWLLSDRMRMQMMSARSEQSKDWIEVVAFGNAEMEGQVFRARADSISYDESKDLVTLKGGPSQAGIWYQRVPGQPSEESFAKTIQFWPSVGRVRADRTSGVSFAP